MSDHAAVVCRADDAMLAACLLAVDPFGLGGASLRAAHGPAVDRFLNRLRHLLPVNAPFRRVPLHIADNRLLGGIDLTSTLQMGRPVLERGLLADADRGCIILPMAERLPLSTAARLSAVLDSREIVVERDGFSCRNPSRFTLIALDEGVSDDERPPSVLLDRIALHLKLEAYQYDDSSDVPFGASQIAAARTILPEVIADDAMLTALCQAASAIGIVSIRAPILAMRTACAHAALFGRTHLTDEDAIVVGRLVLASRATILPVSESENSTPETGTAQGRQPSPESASTASATSDDTSTASDAGELQDIVLAAARAAIPADLLVRIQALGASRNLSTPAGRVGAQRQSVLRGRPAGVQRGELKSGTRLNVVETLRAAAPWQKIRRRPESGRVRVYRDDFRVTRFKQRSETATIFVVDASGSSALHRLGEAKGAVELLLADCYVRRDQVALIAFRGKGAELILPPTRSLARAKRSLSALPGGGGTPVAAAIDAASALADGLRRRGLASTIVLLTDGRANVARDGAGGRDRAEADALGAARSCRALQLTSLLVDTSPAPSPAAERLALEMGARYLALPRADATTISQVVRNAS